MISVNRQFLLGSASASRCVKFSAMKGHAPWLAGSSCTQRTSLDALEAIELLDEIFRWKWVEPLDRDDGHLAVLPGLAAGVDQIPTNLS